MAAVINSVVASCKRHKLDPQAYLADVLRRLPIASHDDMLSMLPNIWSPKLPA